MSKPRATNGTAIDAAAGNACPAPPEGCSNRRSPTTNGSSRPCSTSASCAPRTPSPNCSRSAGAPSATSSVKSARSWPNTDSPPHRPPPDSPPPLSSSLRSPATRTPRHCQVDSLQLHKIANVLGALPKSAHPGAKKALAEIWNAEDRRHAHDAVSAFKATYGAKFGKAVAKITDDLEVLLSFYDFPAEHWQHLRTTNPIESTFATVRHRTKITRGPGSRAAGLAMAFKLIEAAQDRWRAVNGPHLVALVRAGATFVNGKLVERPDEDHRSEAA